MPIEGRQKRRAQRRHKKRSVPAAALRPSTDPPGYVLSKAEARLINNVRALSIALKTDSETLTGLIADGAVDMLEKARALDGIAEFLAEFLAPLLAHIGRRLE